MVKSVQEFQARAAACRAAAASEALEKVRQIHLKAASKWDMLASEAQWIPSAGEQSIPQQSGATARSGLSLQVDGWPRNDLLLSTVPDAIEASCSAQASLHDVEMDESPAIMSQQGSASESAKIMLFAADGHLRKLTDIEGDVIRLAIERYRGRISEVARRLGIGRSTLYRKMGEHGIDSPS